MADTVGGFYYDNSCVILYILISPRLSHTDQLQGKYKTHTHRLSEKEGERYIVTG